MKYLLCCLLTIFPLSVSLAEVGCIDDNYLYTIPESIHVSANKTISIILSFNEPIEWVTYVKQGNTLLIKDCFTSSGFSSFVGDVFLKQEAKGLRVVAPKGYSLSFEKKGSLLHLTFTL
jgi:hypothetical protein